MTPWTAADQASLFFTILWSLFKLTVHVHLKVRVRGKMKNQKAFLGSQAIASSFFLPKMKITLSGNVKLQKLWLRNPSPLRPGVRCFPRKHELETVCLLNEETPAPPPAFQHSDPTVTRFFYSLRQDWRGFLSGETNQPKRTLGSRSSIQRQELEQPWWCTG